MATGSARARTPVEHCPNCLLALRPRDRFCAACGMRLERPDLRAAGRATPAPAAPLAAPLAPPASPAAAPAAPAADRGLAAALIAVLLVGMISLAIALLVAVAGSENEAPTLVTTPQVVTAP